MEASTSRVTVDLPLPLPPATPMTKGLLWRGVMRIPWPESVKDVILQVETAGDRAGAVTFDNAREIEIGIGYRFTAFQVHRQLFVWP